MITTDTSAILGGQTIRHWFLQVLKKEQKACYHTGFWEEWVRRKHWQKEPIVTRIMATARSALAGSSPWHHAAPQVTWQRPARPQGPLQKKTAGPTLLPPTHC